MTDQPRPGWYEDPTDATQQRWWSGTVWTDRTRPNGAADTAVIPAQTAAAGPAAGVGPGSAAAAGGAARGASVATRLGLVAGALVLVIGSVLATVWVLDQRGDEEQLAAGSVPESVDPTPGSALDDPDTADDRPPFDPGPPDEPLDTPDEPLDTPDEPLDTPDEPLDTPDEPLDTPDEPLDTPDEPLDTPDEPLDTPDEPLDTPDEPLGTPDDVVTEEPFDGAAVADLNESDLVARVSAYVGALDAGDIGSAHAQLTPALQQRPGWSLTEFVDFWDGYLEGAALVDVNRIVPARGEIEAVVHYTINGGRVSEEQIILRMVRSSSGEVLIEDYTVERARRVR